jgi:acyl dehydratase
MLEPASWGGIAYNHATESENAIHSDEVAKRYGFRGGLVPGVSVYAYLVHPAVFAWGLDWLGRGASSVSLRKPLYDGSAFRVEPKLDGPRSYRGEVIDPEGVVCADGRVSLPEAPPEAPAARRGDAPAPAHHARPEATRATLEMLRERGMGSLRLEWPTEGEPDRYLRDLDGMPDLIRLDRGGFANPAFTVGLANWALTANVRLGPWIHAESRVQHHAPIVRGSALVVESSVTDVFERSGHEFVDLDVTVFLEPDTPAMSAHHRAIYKLRSP